MRMQMLAVGLMALIAVGFTGCTNPVQMTAGPTVVQYDKGQQPMLTEAPSDGEYGLYEQTGASAKVRVSLKKGDKLGFKRSDDGRVIAVAGGKEFPRTDQDLRWRRTDDK